MKPNSLHTAVEAFRESKDPEAFRYLYTALSGKLYYVCLRYLKNEADAQDALQETFVTAFNKFGSYSGNGSFEGWIRRIAVNHCLGKLKLSQRDFSTTSDERTLDKLAEEEPYYADREETEALLLKALHALPPGYRTILNLAILEDYSHREIAALLHITESTSRSQLTRAKTALKSTLEQL